MRKGGGGRGEKGDLGFLKLISGFDGLCVRGSIYGDESKWPLFLERNLFSGTPL